MSERKSWDIQPKKKPVQQPAPAAPAASPVPSNNTARTQSQRQRIESRIQQRIEPQKGLEPMVRRSALQKRRGTQPPQLLRRTKQKPEPVKAAVVRREHVPQGREREPLKIRRKRARKLAQRLAAVGMLLLVVAAGLALWLPIVRVQDVRVSGTDSDGIHAIVMNDLQGSYYFIFPRSSILFFPSKTIRADILAKYPELSAVSIMRTSFSSIYISSILREAAFLWCGDTYNSDAGTISVSDNSASSTTAVSNDVGVLSPCYDADSEGYVFAQDPNTAGDTLRVFGPLFSVSSPVLGNRIADAGAIPDALSFVKQIKSMNIPIVSLVLRGDEADLYAQSGTKITYVLGREDMAYQLAQSAFPTLNLNDGSLNYVDLRFDGKVYFKKKGEGISTSGTTSAQ